MMRGPDDPRSARVPRVTLVTVVGLLVLLALPRGGPLAAVGGAAAQPASPAAAPDVGHTWSNGAVQLTFPSARPTFTLASVALPTDLVRQTLTGLAEINAAGAIGLFARFSSENATWAISSHATPDATVVSLTGQVPVLNYSGEWESGDDGPSEDGSVGNVSVAIAFDLNVSSSPNPWTLGYSINASGWPWRNASDFLGVEVRSNLSASSDRWLVGTGNSLSAVGATNTTHLATYRWESTALAVYSGGGEEDSNVGSYHNLSTGAGTSLVRLEFGAVSGGYAALAYDPWLGIVPVPGSLGALPAWLFTPASLAVIALGVVGSAALAVWTRSSRTPPETGL